MLAHSIPFSPDIDAAAFARIPVCAGVFLLRGGEAHSEPYGSKANNLRRRIMRLLAPPSEQGISKRLNLRSRCASIEFTPTGSDFENIVLLNRTIREIFPENYARRWRLNMSPLVRINWENAYPRAYVTRKAGRIVPRGHEQRKSVYYGPFQSKAIAEKVLNDTLDLFKSRRCTFELHPDPTFPGCVYSEMKMCLAPCFKGCSDEEYISETTRVQDFFDSRGQSLMNKLTAQRDKVSADLDFESAAALHARIEKAKGVARGFDEIVRRLEELDALVIQPAALDFSADDVGERKAQTESPAVERVAIFRFAQGQILGPVGFSFSLPAASAQPEEQDSTPIEEGHQAAAAVDSKEDGRAFAASIEELQPGATPNGATYMENLAILKRWYYRSNRTGEIFFRDPKGNWPLRRMLRAAARVGSARLAPPTESVTPPVSHPS